MTDQHPPFSFGIEEEYLLVDLTTRGLAPEAPGAMLAACEKKLGKLFSREYMNAQIEVATPVCNTPDEARSSLLRSRRAISKLAAEHGLAPMAAATHPFTSWRPQNHTDTPRYNSVAHDLQGLGRRMIVNGLHVHVGIANNADRIRLMNELRPYLPVLLALSTSSPFWQSEDTGLKSYRTAINDSTPRKGIPEVFSSWRDYQNIVDVLCKSGVIEDGSNIWWDLRPSARFPTLEMRITDVCPLVEDGLCIAALFRCLCRQLSRAHDSRVASHQIDLPLTRLAIVNENRWRAERYGIDRGMVDPEGGCITSFAELIDDLLEALHEDAVFFDCVGEIEHARVILARGTSADRQRDLFRRCLEQGLPLAEAMKCVVDQLVAETSADRGSFRSTKTGRYVPPGPAIATST
jgi:glutamate---cysteine ligase / carboxylate-amine ligase